MDKNYVVYHLHSEDSLLDSCTNHKLYTDKAVELGQTAIGFSEHGNRYNWIEKKLYANSKGLKFIDGCEVYLTEKLTWDPDDKHEKEYKVRDNYHTILIAKNIEGRREMNLAIDKSTMPDHFYYKPRITFEEFLNLSDNVIKISACLASPLFRYPKSESADSKMFERLLTHYDYLEVQPHVNSIDQIKYNKALAIASKKYNIPLIAGTDTHSLDKYKAECRSLLMKSKGIEFSGEDEFDLTYKSYDEIVAMFKQQGALSEEEYLSALENTNVLAASVEDDELDISFKYPKVDDEEKELKERINRMYKEKVKKGIIKADKRYAEKVKEEMAVFKQIDMVGFMLFMSKITCWCWENGIPLGFCRGSVGGSMIAYLTDIIDVNPLKWDTIFSRFANSSRKEIGDIDLDISPSQRHLVYEHIISEYGLDKTAYVLSIGTISEKGTIDEIGRGLSTLWAESELRKQGITDFNAIKTKRKDMMADKRNPYHLNVIAHIKKEFDEDPDKTKEEHSDIFYYFDGMLDTAISQSMHPAGIIVSPITLPDNYGTFWNDGKRILTINMEEIHEVSLVKYDLLGLRNVEIIKDCCQLAGIPYPKSHEVNWDDEEVWNHITDSPVGIFQFESKFAFDSLKQMGCHCVNDLSLVNASIRPSGESYRDRLLARETNKNPSELIDKLLEKNRGFLIFQEDTIKFLTEICGMEGSEADNVRRAIGRKQKDRLEAALPQILEGYCRMSPQPREVAEKEARTFLQIIEDSSNYQFGFNHSTGYSMIGYMCGYLRYYYPTEFITAYLNNANNDEDITSGTELAKQLNISIANIKFRHSQAKYSCSAKDKIIYKGLSSIKFMNDSVAEKLYTLKDNKYNSFIELLIDISEIKIDSRQLDILIKLDFFSEFGEINQLLKQTEMFKNIYDKKQFKKNKLEELGVPEFLLEKYAGKATEKMYKDVDTLSLLKHLCKITQYPKTKLLDKIEYELEHLGYIQLTWPGMGENYYYVQAIDKNWAKLYQLKAGATLDIKFRKNNYNKNPFYEKTIIKVTKIAPEPKWIKITKPDGSDGWDRDPNNMEDILQQWTLVK